MAPLAKPPPPCYDLPRYLRILGNMMSEITCYQCQTPLDANAAACPKCGLPQILRGRYRIRRLLGQGGFGVVYEAVDLDLNRHYAIKLITATSPAIREQVAIEAQILAQHARRLPFMP